MNGAALCCLALVACGGSPGGTTQTSTATTTRAVAPEAAPELSDEEKCKNGDPGGCDSLALDASLEGDLDALIAYYRRSCFELENGESCRSGASELMIIAGGDNESFPEPPELKLYDLIDEFEIKGCELNDAESCGSRGLAMMGKDPIAGRKLQEKACDMGAGMYCYFLGQQALEEMNNGTLAHRYYDKACKLGGFQQAGLACDMAKRLAGGQ